MYHGIYAPWDHYPKHLRFGEMQNPLIVLIDFFSWDWLENHRKHLKVWRQFIISHERYKCDPYDACDLLHVYEMHLKLLEALYVLLLEYRDTRYALSEKDRPSREQLNDEKERWLYFPANLTEAELLNPYAVLEKIFDSMSLPEYRDHLQDWLHAALSAHEIDEAIEAREIYYGIRKSKEDVFGSLADSLAGNDQDLF
ncbi:hypothetical protein IM792_20945 [Mucilaginibacter sp. JRF]|uniref:hypothetical protein n=1 Tax=Mucilaginibacter sp. JRF TaxID=2780088 RepID=UPI001881EB73|nr:hypothetical protein [Mucilaginibacter sp. JRF]MBE9586930.1 hypothetical protein [Mucilaginibacter sp. JRF]